MKKEHYVSLESAKKLKKLGYESNSGYFFHTNERSYKLVYAYPLKPDELIEELYYAPTLLDAMDWLEDRGILITIAWLNGVEKWTFIFDGIKGSIAATKILDYYYRKRHTDHFADRNECMRNAIERALELL